MPFEPIPTLVKAPKDSRASISYQRFSGKNAKPGKKNPRLIIGIPKTVMDGFAPKPTQLFGIAIGTGKDKGKAQIVPAMIGAKPTVLKGGTVFRFGYVPMLGEDAAEKEFVAVKSVAGGFEIDLPAWFKADSP